MNYLEQDDVSFESMRSSGPGGQHGDRRATAVRLRVNINAVPVDDDERDFLFEHLPPRYRTKDGELIVENGETRSQRQNRKKALEQANDIIESAIEEGRHQREAEKRKKRSRKKSGGGGGEKDIKEEMKQRRRSETTDDLIEEAFEEDPDTMESYVDDSEENDGE